MKFSFDFEKYRENLAEKIKEKKQESQEKAGKFLEQAKKTDQYKIAKVIKETSFDIEKIKKNRKELAVEEQFESYTIEEKDIGDLIPEDVKLYIDGERLREIKRTGFEILPFEGFDKKRKEDVVLKAKDFVNEITDGDFYNPDRLNTVIFSLEKNDLINEKMERRVPVRKSFDMYPESVIKNLWFASNSSGFFIPTKILIIANPFSENFKERIDAIKDRDNYTYFHENPYVKPVEDYLLSDYDNIIKKALKCASDDKIGGINIEFRRSYNETTTDTKLVDIADWIVDLPREKLYKIHHLEK